MKIAWLHYTPRMGIPFRHFYSYGWGAALSGYDVDEKDCTLKCLEEADGEYDICFVTPGFAEIGKHLYKKKSKTKYVLFTEEDMHQGIETLKCIADYYDYVYLFSGINFFSLCQLGVKNVKCILPCYAPDIFDPLHTKKAFSMAFLGQYDYLFHINGFTRRQYCQEIERDFRRKAFIGKGFYAEKANEIYNDSLIALDLPIMHVIGPRSFSIGATSAMLMLPAHCGTYLWPFQEGEDYITFDGMDDMKKVLHTWIEKPDECLKISKNMNEKMQEHTYKKRFEEILTHVIA